MTKKKRKEKRQRICSDNFLLELLWWLTEALNFSNRVIAPQWQLSLAAAGTICVWAPYCRTFMKGREKRQMVVDETAGVRWVRPKGFLKFSKASSFWMNIFLVLCFNIVLKGDSCIHTHKYWIMPSLRQRHICACDRTGLHFLQGI